MTPRLKLTFTVLPDTLAICRLDGSAPLPGWAFKGPLSSVTRTRDELSIVCADDQVPHGLSCQRGWRAIKVSGPLDFELTGVLASLAEPLAEAGISTFAIATYDTDYVLVREERLESSIGALTAAGHKLSPV